MGKRNVRVHWLWYAASQHILAPDFAVRNCLRFEVGQGCLCSWNCVLVNLPTFGVVAAAGLAAACRAASGVCWPCSSPPVPAVTAEAAAVGCGWPPADNRSGGQSGLPASSPHQQQQHSSLPSSPCQQHRA
jgi:hypothetical protein